MESWASGHRRARSRRVSLALLLDLHVMLHVMVSSPSSPRFSYDAAVVQDMSLRRRSLQMPALG
ncbi:MAG: hypothetical protein ACRDJI_01540 [Actinomycetota bacterium]